METLCQPVAPSGAATATFSHGYDLAMLMTTRITFRATFVVPLYALLTGNLVWSAVVMMPLAVAAPLPSC